MIAVHSPEEYRVQGFAFACIVFSLLRLFGWL